MDWPPRQVEIGRCFARATRCVLAPWRSSPADGLGSTSRRCTHRTSSLPFFFGSTDWATCGRTRWNGSSEKWPGRRAWRRRLGPFRVSRSLRVRGRWSVRMNTEHAGSWALRRWVPVEAGARLPAGGPPAKSKPRGDGSVSYGGRTEPRRGKPRDQARGRRIVLRRGVWWRRRRTAVRADDGKGNLGTRPGGTVRQREASSLD